MPLLGSSGGSSEYAYRGTLDDWPVDFSTSLSAQDLTGQNPTSTLTATLTVTGLNYKARVIVENPNANLSIISENGVAVNSPYVLAREADPAVLIRDNTVIRIRLQPTSGTLADFNKTYTIPVKIGKRQGTWTVNIRPVDETPNTITFPPLLDQDLGITTTSNTITVSGLEPGFSFPIVVSANDGLGNISFYKNGAGPGVTGTVVNGDQIYLSTLTPTTYLTARVFTVQVGTSSTSWSILTRGVDVGINAFNFTGIASATNLGTEYVSNSIQISGADAGPTFDPPNPTLDLTALPVTISGPNAFYEIRKSDNTLRYTDPLFPAAPNYWQNVLNYAYNGDRLQVKINASTSYSTAVVGILTVSNQSASYIVTTRPTPFNTIPSAFSFASLTDQPRGSLVSSASTTLVIVDNISGTFGTASISNSTSGISPEFQVTRGGITTTYTSAQTAQVRNSDIITLRMTTPNTTANNGVSNSFITFRVNGTDTRQNFFSGNGYSITNGLQESTWNVSTIARSCPITTFTLDTATGVSTSTDRDITFTPSGYNTDCQMTVSVTSDSSIYNFVAVNGSPITATKTLTNVAPGSSITLRVRSSSLFLTDVTSTVTVSNSSSGVTPSSSYSTNWVVTTTGNTTPASATLSSNLSSVESGKPFTLTWSSINCTSVRSVSWSATPPTSGIGSTTLTAPVSAGIYPYNITLYANPFASNYSSFPTDLGTGIGYTTATTSITVIEDTTPLFTPNDFTNLTGVSISGIGLTSNTLVISDISVPLTGIITGNTGASFYDSGSPSGIITSLTLNSGNSITLKVDSSPDYLTTTTAYLSVKDSLGVVKANKSFSVTTADCTPTTSLVSFPSASGSDYVTLNSYTNARYTDLAGSTDTVQILYGDSVSGGIVTSFGSATNYYNLASPLPSAGYFQNYPTTIVTWSKLIDIIYYAYTSTLKRPPTIGSPISEVDSLLANNTPSAYATASAFFDAIVLGINADPNLNSISRNTSFPIYNSCPPPPASTTSIIKVGTYSSITAGSYPIAPP